MIHTNEGEGDQKEGWYDFYKGILLTDDNTYSCPLKMRIFWASDA